MLDFVSNPRRGRKSQGVTRPTRYKSPLLQVWPASPLWQGPLLQALVSCPKSYSSGGLPSTRSAVLGHRKNRDKKMNHRQGRRRQRGLIMVVALLGGIGLALTAIWCMLMRPWAARQAPEPEGLVQLDTLGYRAQAGAGLARHVRDPPDARGGQDRVIQPLVVPATNTMR